MSDRHNRRNASDAQASQLQALPIAVLVREHGDEDTHLANVQVQGDRLILEFDDGRSMSTDWGELSDRVMAA